MECSAKHTLYQPTDEEWKCPKCGRGNDSFWIDASVGSGECELLHDDDEIICFECGYDTTGKKFAARIQKEKNLVRCPYCNGKGFVDRSKSVPTRREVGELVSIALALREYIDAIPEDIQFNKTMPGVDRDWVDFVIDKFKSAGE